MRLRKKLRSETFDNLEYLRSVRAAGVEPNKVTNRQIRNMIFLAKDARWRDAVRATAKATQSNPTTTLLATVRASTVRYLSKRSVQIAVAVVLFLAASILFLLLTGCATHRPPMIEQTCIVTPCGDTCCNDDQKVCPTCWEEPNESRPDR